MTVGVAPDMEGAGWLVRASARVALDENNRGHSTTNQLCHLYSLLLSSQLKNMSLSIILTFLLALVLFAIYVAVVVPYRNPLYPIAGPPITKWFGNHMGPVLE